MTIPAQWPGKILLLGEYTVLTGSSALALPAAMFQGQWQPGPTAIDHRLYDFACWLNNPVIKETLSFRLDAAAFLAFAANGGRFESNIPLGYGMGSSGALVAAVVARWGSDIPEEFVMLRKGLASMEAYFHGHSSGLDPLVSFLKKPVHIAEDTLSFPVFQLPERRFFLLDSGMPRNTATLVAGFKARMEQPAYADAINGHLSRANQEAIHSLLHAQAHDLDQLISTISQVQGELFQSMIPEPIRPFWQGSGHVLKLCGAGGGGFFLGYTFHGVLPDLPFPMQFL